MSQLALKCTNHIQMPCFNHFHSGYRLIGTLANSEDPDEMTNKVAFHQSLHCLLRQKQSSGIEIHNFIEIFDQLLLEIQNGQFHTYCFNIYGIIYKNKKGLICMYNYPVELDV